MRHRGNPHGLGPIVGREDELAAVEDFIAGTRGPAALVIEGAPGIGKTTLWRAGAESPEASVRRVLRARPVQAEAEMAFSGLDALLSEVVDEVLDRLPAPQRSALEVALLRAPEDAVEIEPRAVAGATLSALRALAAHEPLLLAIDDLQWLDQPTVRVLQIALSRLSDEPVLVLAATRPAASAPELGLERELVSVIELDGLDVESLRRLARERMQVALSLPAARRLAELSGGNPYYALELLDSGATDRGFELDGATDLKRLVGRRLSAMPQATRDALGTLAATAHPTVELVSRLVGGEAVLDPAFAAGLLEHDGRQVRFAHPLLAAASYQALSPTRRRAARRRLAELADDEVERARHLAAATVAPSAAIAASVERGARAAAARGAPSVAADLFEAAAELTPESESDRATARRLEVARQLFAAGEGRRALDRCAALLDELPAGELRADVLTTMAWRGKLPVDRALAMCEQAVAECDGAESRARCLLLLSNVVQTHDVERALDCAREALATLGDDDDPSLRAWALGMLGAYRVFSDPAGDGIELLREAAALEREHGSQAPDVYLQARTQLGFALMWRDELDEARELLASQHDRATLAGQEAGASTVGLHLAELEIRAGRLQTARAYAQDALALEDEGEDTQTLAALLYARAHVAALEGEVELAEALAERGLAVGRAVGDGIFPMHNRWVLGTLALALGDAERAVEYLHSLPAECEALGFLEPGSGPFTSDCLDALIAAGRLDDADAMCGRWEALGGELDRPRLLATGARARGLIAAARGDLERGVESLERALAEHERLPVPHERARTLLAYGTTLRRAGRRRDARAALAQAGETFESIGQPLWAQRARDEAGRLAGRRPEGAELTEGERQVAELVAAGHSNREVAGTLFITVRTVEANLTRVYRKLDLRSRAELAARWSELALSAAE